MRIVLASSSPRRQELLKMFDLSFEVITEKVDEFIDENKNHYEECMNVSKRKALKILEKIDEDVIIIAGDTIVSQNGKVLGKPRDKKEALEMLIKINGTVHEVISSICVLARINNTLYENLDYDKCKVFVSKMDIQEMHDWIDKHNVNSYAGGYAIQEGFCKYIEKVEGDYFSIVGLPVHKLYKILKKYI